MSEPRYIDANALKERLKTFEYREHGKENKSGQCVIDYFMPKIIDAEPTADVREVVHAKWDPVGNLFSYRCGNCGHHCGCKENYCPKCGAKMDKED